MEMYLSNIQGLGVTASSVRTIKNGKEYERFFSVPTGETSVIKSSATVFDTINFVAKVAKETTPQVQALANELLRQNGGKKNKALLKIVFDFFYQHYQYKLDEPGHEEVRSPRRAWQDRKTGIDCDCFSTSVSAVLNALQISHYLKIIKLNNKDYYQHIYVVVPNKENGNINLRSNYTVIDPVLDTFDDEAKTITQTHHLHMALPLEYLNGVENNANSIGQEFENLGNVNTNAQPLCGRGVKHQFHKSMRQHIRNTQAHVQAHPHKYAQVYNVARLKSHLQKAEQAFAGVIDEELNGLGSLGAAHAEAQMEGVLEQLSATEHELLHPELQGLAGAICGSDDYLYGALAGDADDAVMGEFGGLGRKKGKLKEKLKAVAKKTKNGFFTAVKNATKQVKEKTKKIGGKAKGFAKKAGRAVLKYNPLTLAARAGMLVAMRTNFARLGEKAYWGYFTQAEAAAKGVDAEFYNASVTLLNKIKRVFIKTLKGTDLALKKAIINGRAAKRAQLLAKKRGAMGSVGDFYGMHGCNSVSGLGVAVAAASITSAMAFITPLVAQMKSIFKGLKFRKRKEGDPEPEPGTEPEPGAEEPMLNEDGTLSTPPPDAENIFDALKFTNDNNANPKASQNVANDGSPEAAAKVNEQEETIAQAAQANIDSTSDDNTNGTTNNARQATASNTDIKLNPDGTPATPWYKKPIVIGAAILGTGVAIWAMNNNNTPKGGMAGATKKKSATAKKKYKKGLGNVTEPQEVTAVAIV
jgi:hypothetical protein